MFVIRRAGGDLLPRHRAQFLPGVRSPGRSLHHILALLKERWCPVCRRQLGTGAKPALVAVCQNLHPHNWFFFWRGEPLQLRGHAWWSWLGRQLSGFISSCSSIFPSSGDPSPAREEKELCQAAVTCSDLQCSREGSGGSVPQMSWQIWWRVLEGGGGERAMSASACRTASALDVRMLLPFSFCLQIVSRYQTFKTCSNRDPNPAPANLGAESSFTSPRAR